MKLILSGEGPTDLGTVKLVAGKWEFVPGPMAWIVDQLLKVNYTTYSLLEFHQAGGNCVIYVGKKRAHSMPKRRAYVVTGLQTWKGKCILYPQCPVPRVAREKSLRRGLRNPRDRHLVSGR